MKDLWAIGLKPKKTFANALFAQIEQTKKKMKERQESDEIEMEVIQGSVCFLAGSLYYK